MADERLRALQAYHAKDPDDAFVRFALAQEYAKRGNVEKACALYESLVEAQPAYTGTYYHLGKLYASLGRSGEAAEVFRRGIAVTMRKGVAKDLSELQQALMDLEHEQRI